MTNKEIAQIQRAIEQSIAALRQAYGLLSAVHAGVPASPPVRERAAVAEPAPRPAVRRPVAKPGQNAMDVRKDTILDLWEQGERQADIARALDQPFAVVSNTVFKARRAGDPRAALRHKHRVAPTNGNAHEAGASS